MKYRAKSYGPTYGTKDESYEAMMNFRDSIDNNDVLDIPVNEYLKLNKTTKDVLKGFKVGVDFQEQEIFIDPYLLGAWLGDGHSDGSGFTNVDGEVLRYVEYSLEQIKCDMILEVEDSITYRIAGTVKYDNPFRSALNFYKLRNNKHIPLTFLHNSRRIRLWVLAGLIDTDGYRTSDGTCYEIIQKNKRLSEDIAYLARSLGFFVSYKQVKKSCMYKGEKREGVYYKCVISGNGLDKVPVLLERKKCSLRKQKKDVMVTNITVKPVGEGQYCGFTIDGNRRFLLHDFTVTHNTATMSMFLNTTHIDNKKNLIVCPFSILTTWKKWLNDTRTWDTDRRKANILIYHGQNRSNYLSKLNKYDYIITTYQIISTGELSRAKWDKVVLDESHNIKNGLCKNPPKCATAAFIIGKKARSRFCISGTPFNNKITDIASQSFFIGVKPYNNSSWWDNNFDNKEAMKIWNETCLIKRTKESMLKPPIYHNITIEPTEKEKDIVNKLRKNAAEDFENWKKAKSNKNNYERMKLQGKILSLIQKLRIYSNSYYCGNNIVDAEDIITDCNKVEKIINDIGILVNKDPKHGIVVFSQFISFLDVLEISIDEFIPEIQVMKFTGNMNKDERDNIVDNFNKSTKPRVILVSLMAGGVGLSLHHGSSTVLLSEPYYNPFMEQQAEERVHRLGQENQVNVYKYYTNNSVEDWINKLKEKKMYLAGSLDLVRKDMIPTNINFDDIAELFKEFVSFKTEDEDKDEKKEVKKKPKKSKKNSKIQILKRKK